MCPSLLRRHARPACLAWALLLGGASLGVQAQQPARPAATAASSPATMAPAAAAARPQATDAQAPVPPLRHVSALSAHTRSAPVVVGDWPALNQQVARIGGWRAYAREAAAAASAATPASAPPQPTGVTR
jgi:hypothetical protein